VVNIVLALVIGYLLGSIPFAYLAGRAVKGVDVRTMGNPGTLTVMRQIGLVPGLAVMVLDAAKGSFAVWIAQWLGAPVLYVYLAGLTAMLGHSWSIFMRFDGGGAIATTCGALLAVAPWEFAIAAAFIIIALFITSNMRFSAAVGLVLLPFVMWAFGENAWMIAYAVALPVLMVLRNVTRLKTEAATGQLKEGLIMDRTHTPWQTKRKPKAS